MNVRAITPAADRFDDMTRNLAKGTVSRRRTLALIGSSLFGGALGSVGLFDDTDAAKSCKKKCKKKEGKARRRCNKRCKKKEEPKTDCPNLGTACGKGGQTLVCNCRLKKEGDKQTCGNVVNPPNGMAFTACNLSSDCAKGEFCDFGGNVCRRSCETA